MSERATGDHAAADGGILLSGYTPGALGAIAALHGAWYGANWGFGLYFEAKVARELADFLERLQPDRDALWVARLPGDAADAGDGAGRVVGSVVIDGLDAAGDGARLRWFILHPAARGRGVGRRLMGEAMAFCRRAGFRRVYLHTFAGLDAARHLYETHGFALYHEADDSTWGTPVREQAFEWFPA